MGNKNDNEAYIEKAHSDLQELVKDLMDELREYSDRNDLEYVWVLNSFLYKLSYKVDDYCKKK